MPQALQHQWPTIAELEPRFCIGVASWGRGPNSPYAASTSCNAREAANADALPTLLTALELQFDALADLGAAASAGIVTPEVTLLRSIASTEGAVFGPSGAGGGDIAIYLARKPSSPAFRKQAQLAGFELLTLQIGAPGVSITAR